MKRLFLLLAILASAAVQAEGTTAKLSWSTNYVYTDTTPIPASDIASFVIRWDGGGSLTVTPPVTFPVIVPVPCGNRTFTVELVTKPGAKYPGTSDPTTGVPNPYVSGITCKPGPIQGVTVS